MNFTKKILIFMGMFGSGKTEIALNVSRLLTKNGERVALADIDTISPYYRSRDMRDSFAQFGIKIIAPKGKLAHADLPIIPPEIFGYVENPDFRVVLDVGGSDDGAVVLSSLSSRLPDENCETFYVLNPFRPFNDTVENAASHFFRLQEKSRMKINYLVNNTNIGSETTSETIDKGEEFVKQLSEKVSVPVAFTVVMNGLNIEPRLFEQLEIKKYMLNPWEVE
ncbi:MAG: cobalamin biosynthesis protein CobQ [Kosmotogaceae bacterium]|nr:cobalamin biosynthesis protein CobQ [Kosmotogaceae bacterium]